MKKKTAVLLRCVVLLVTLAVFAAKPPVTGADSLPREYAAAIQDQSAGLYSETLPLVPLFVSVEEFKEDRVLYTIHYLPFGTVGMSYTKTDGYNIEKQLSPLS